MTYKQIEQLRMMVRKEALAAALEAELLTNQRRSERDLSHRIEALRYEAGEHARQVIE
jgi:hypothetical protein